MDFTRTRPAIHEVARETNFRSEREFALQSANAEGPETLDLDSSPWWRHTEPPPTGRRVPRRERYEHVLVGLVMLACAAGMLGALVFGFLGRVAGLFA